MARPWRKRSAWPYISKKGRKSYTIGFYDHDKVERSRAFPTAGHARAWMNDYMTTERRGRESLRRFLLDLDAKQANEAQGAHDAHRSLADILALYLCVDGDPHNQNGLAPATYARYRSTIGCHLVGHPGDQASLPAPYAVVLGRASAASFNEPTLPRRWREQMIREGVPKSTRKQAWQVLSAALTWAAASSEVPEIQINGCRLAGQHHSSRRRSARAGGTGNAPRPRRQGPLIPSWALSPQAVEAIRHKMLTPAKNHNLFLAHRDAMIVDLQYGLAARNQEIWALRWDSVTDEFVWITEVLSSGQLSDWGKTEKSTQRRIALPSLLAEDLCDWRHTLELHGHRTSPRDFVIAGDLSGAQHGTRESTTQAVHFGANHVKRWGRRRFRPAVEQVSRQPRFHQILGATQYALRRGGISLRLRSEDPLTVASECGTSLKMLSDHYAFAIQDLRKHGPRSFDEEWRAARGTHSQAIHKYPFS